jgi:single-strand DNA-binding protein
MNVVVLQGSLSSPPQVRTLPSGDTMVAYEVTTRDGDQPAESVPVVWFTSSAKAAELAAGTEVVVTGRVRRRYFRLPSGTGSRTEVVAEAVVPAAHRKRCATAVAAAVERTVGATG